MTNLVPFQKITGIELVTLDRKVEKGLSKKVIFWLIPDLR